ncbi:MAG TPA: carboxymuconolactone decarboxylase family protein [Thermomicrobiales bacterium]|nr:carboxymuconolactone decarboxylase family protein [Thermomicrobiales bacterium]
MATPYRYTKPIAKKAASGRVAAVYAQIAAEFILADGPLMSLSPAPETLAATWALLREAQLAGQAPRVDKEVVAAAVSAANGCQFCVDAHVALVHAAGAHHLAEAIWRGEPSDDANAAMLVAWAKATARSDARIAPPFPTELAAEYLGTALVTHFINRMVDALLNGKLLPGRLQESALVRRVAGRALGRTVRLQPPPGESLPLVADLRFGAPPAWAGNTPIGQAYVALRRAGAGGGDLLGDAARDRVLTTIAGWNGEAAPMDDALADALAGLHGGDRAGVRLALLAAVDPHRVADADVAAWREFHPADADLIRMLAFGAMAAVERIATWTTIAARPAASLAVAGG